MEIRPFSNKDITALIELIKLNTPRYFAVSEGQDFLDYLNNEVEDYYVVESNEVVIGCGGINYGFDNGATARISWDLIHPDYQGRGIGRKLLKFRIDEIKKNQEIKKIVVRSTQLAYQFYLKNGFELKYYQLDYWEKGFDLYEMEMILENEN